MFTSMIENDFLKIVVGWPKKYYFNLKGVNDFMSPSRAPFTGLHEF